MTDPVFCPRGTDLPVAIKRHDGNLGLASTLLSPEEARRLAEWLTAHFGTSKEEGGKTDGTR